MTLTHGDGLEIIEHLSKYRNAGFCKQSRNHADPRCTYQKSLGPVRVLDLARFRSIKDAWLLERTKSYIERWYGVERDEGVTAADGLSQATLQL